ncbi:MAG: glutathionylspermidine synthase family protein [Corynebacteriales bacterium]|nr:glutathionylspermidine synthase family protein [Mycobacteriales bacterium]
MRREHSSVRKNWPRIVEEQGLAYHESSHPDGLNRPYWDESAHYVFTMPEVLALEEQVEELHRMCLTAVDHVIKERRFADFAIPLPAWPAIEASWNRRDRHILGRFDFRYDGNGPAKLLEYNADTPTSLLETSVIQWFWLQDTFPDDDQWNSVHERLIEEWKSLNSQLVHFAWTNCDETGEEAMTVAYLQETAEQAGLATMAIAMEDIGWDEAASEFADVDGTPITTIFKLYPWEWMVQDAFGGYVIDDVRAPASKCAWIEPMWKMLLSNKALLAILWELYPNHPNLLPAYLDGPRELQNYIAKPLLGREGASMRIVGEHSQSTSGDYGTEGYVYQQFVALPEFEQEHPVLGCWVIGDEAAGLGIRETRGLITDDTSSFVPHRIEINNKEKK